MPRLDRCTRRLAERRAKLTEIFGLHARRIDECRAALRETDGYEQQTAAMLAIDAAETAYIADLRAERAARGIPTITLAEAAELRAIIVTGGVIA